MVLAFWYPINVKSHSDPIFSSFEAICIEMSNYSFTGYFLCLYRPPGLTTSVFLNLLENVATTHPEHFILGDFNFHLDTQSTARSTFNEILATFDFKTMLFPHIH